MTPEQLRNSILQMAIEGKLTEQRPEDGNAADLLKEIQAEKAKLVKEGKIKKEKPLPEIAEDEIPFEIPDNWCWCRLVELCSVCTGRLDANAQNPQGKYAFFTCGVEVYKTLEYAFDCDAILLGGNNASGDYKMHRYAGKFNAYQRVYVISGQSQITLDYLFVTIKYWLPSLKFNSQGTTTRFIKLSQVENMLIPFPPLAEQKRIVARLEEMLPLVDDYEKAYNELQELNKAFPGKLKNSLLQMAVQGKLTDQRPEDGNAADLLKEIRAEKAKLVKDGVIKKEKPLPEIAEDEIPFELPENWCWCRLGEILTTLTDGTHKTPKYTSSGVPFISVKDISSGKLDFSNTKFISEEEQNELKKRCNPQKGDILLSKVGTTGIPVIVDCEKEFNIFVSVALLKFNNQFINECFLQNIVKSPLVQEQCRDNTRGVGNKNWVMRDIANTLIAVPPLAEQKRIVAKLEQLLPLCDTLAKAQQ